MKKNIGLAVLSFVLISSGVAFGLPQSCKDKTAARQKIFRLRYDSDKNPKALKEANARLKLLTKKCEKDKAKLKKQREGSSGGFLDKARELRKNEEEKAMERAGRLSRFKTGALSRYKGAKERVKGWFSSGTKDPDVQKTSRWKFWRK